MGPEVFLLQWVPPPAALSITGLGGGGGHTPCGIHPPAPVPAEASEAFTRTACGVWLEGAHVMW